MSSEFDEFGAGVHVSNRHPRLLVPGWSHSFTMFPIAHALLGYFNACIIANERSQDEINDWYPWEEESQNEFFGNLPPDQLVEATRRKVHRLLPLAFRSVPLIEAQIDAASIPDTQLVGTQLRDAIKQIAVLVNRAKPDHRECKAVFNTAQDLLNLIGELPRSRKGTESTTANQDGAGSKLKDDTKDLTVNPSTRSSAGGTTCSFCPELEPIDRETGLPPSRIKAKAAYDWAMENIIGMDMMTVTELHGKIMSHPEGPAESIPESAESFGKYLRDAGVKRYGSKGDRLLGRSIRRSTEI